MSRPPPAPWATLPMAAGSSSTQRIVAAGPPPADTQKQVTTTQVKGLATTQISALNFYASSGLTTTQVLGFTAADIDRKSVV